MNKVRRRILRSDLSALGSGGRSFEEGSHLCLKEEKRKMENARCHKLLLVFGVDLAQTRI